MQQTAMHNHPFAMSFPALVIATLAVILGVATSACGDDESTTQPQTDGDEETTELADEDTLEAVEESTPEEQDVEDAEPLTPCAGPAQCQSWQDCLEPGFCVTGSGSVSGRFEVYAPDPALDEPGVGPGYVYGAFRGDGLYIGYSLEVTETLSATLGRAYCIDFREKLSATVYDSLLVCIRQDAIASDTTLPFSQGAFEGTLRTVTIENGKERFAVRGMVSGGAVSFQYAVPAALERINGTLKLAILAK